MKREKTISKNFYDDEILYVDSLGIHLKPGVKRLKYPSEDVDKLESHINYWDLANTKITQINKKNKDWDE